MFPIVSEHLVHRFKFWVNGSIQDGMRRGSKLYQLVAQFPLEQRQQAYALGIDLSHHDIDIVISRSARGYVVWSGLRSKEQATSQAPIPQTVESLAALDRG